MRFRPVARIESGEVRNPQKVNLLDQKSGLFERNPLNPPTKTSFLAHFVAKSGPFAKFSYRPAAKLKHVYVFWDLKRKIFKKQIPSL